MNKIITSLITSLALSSCAYASIYPNDWKPYVSAFGGFSALSDNGKIGSVAGVRGGAENGRWDVSYGYIRNQFDTDGSLLPGDLTLHTLNLEIYQESRIIGQLYGKAGIGGGYTVPNFSNHSPQASETASAGVSGQFGGGLAYSLTPNLSIGLNARYFVFSTNVYRTTRVTETDTILIGGVPSGTVETETEIQNVDSVNFNSLNVTAGLNWRF